MTASTTAAIKTALKTQQQTTRIPCIHRSNSNHTASSVDKRVLLTSTSMGDMRVDMFLVSRNGTSSACSSSPACVYLILSREGWAEGGGGIKFQGRATRNDGHFRFFSPTCTQTNSCISYFPPINPISLLRPLLNRYFSPSTRFRTALPLCRQNTWN